MSGLIRHGNFIDGQWGSGGATYPVRNPANGELITDVQKAGAEETNLAIEAANRALPAWRKLTAKERSQRLKRWSDLMLANQQELATLLSREQGKPLAEAKGEVVYAASFLEWFGEEAKRAYGDVIPSHKADARIIVTKEAIGVVAAITPWNFPLAMVTRKVGPALAAGCTMILKPSEETPLSAFALAVLAEQAEYYPRLAEMTSIPLAAGERMYSRFEFKNVFAAGGLSIVQPDLSHAGGITECLKIASMAEAYDITLAPHCPLGPVALAACLTVDFVSYNAVLQEQSMGIHYNRGGELLDYVINKEDFRITDGYMQPLTKPGLGVVVDEEKVIEASRNAPDWRNPVWRHADGSVAEW